VRGGSQASDHVFKVGEFGQIRRIQRVRAKISPRSRASLRPLWVPKYIKIVKVLFSENRPTKILITVVRKKITLVFDSGAGGRL
jgi:hypothetical protein